MQPSPRPGPGLSPRDEDSEDTLVPRDPKSRVAAALAILERPPSPEVAAMSEDEVMDFACEESRPHGRETARAS